MKLKQLESLLSQVKTFSEPDYELEQYPTSAHLAARIAFTAHTSFDDIEGRVVGDFGCGTGMFAVATKILGSGHTIGIDIDPKALAIAKENIEEFGVEVDLINANLQNIPFSSSSVPRFDTVIMNPPFGTRVKGIDMVFLIQAIQASSRAVYSIHKTTTRPHVMKTAAAYGARGEVIATLKFDIPKMYAFHKKKSVDVDVDLWRFSIGADTSALDLDTAATNASFADARAIHVRRAERSGRKPRRSKASSSSGKGKGTKGKRSKGKRR